jgi:hypothetical protein
MTIKKSGGGDGRCILSDFAWIPLVESPWKVNFDEFLSMKSCFLKNGGGNGNRKPGLDEAISTQNRSNDYPSLHLSIPYLNLLRNSSLSVETYFPMVASTFHP